jgi:hypothetical protein
LDKPVRIIKPFQQFFQDRDKLRGAEVGSRLNNSYPAVSNFAYMNMPSAQTTSDRASLPRRAARAMTDSTRWRMTIVRHIKSKCSEMSLGQQAQKLRPSRLPTLDLFLPLFFLQRDLDF